MKRIVASLLAVLAMHLPASALELTVSGAESVRSDRTPAGSVRLPESPWKPGVLTVATEGAIRRDVLRLPSSAQTTLQLLSGLRNALGLAGFREVFTCADAACGGFDFRFQMDIIGEPDMHVDLGNYRYLLMRSDKPNASPHTIALLASRSQSAGFVHITTVSDAEAPTVVAVPKPVEGAPTLAAAEGLIVDLTTEGHVVLADLDFGSGAATLGPGPYTSLEELANWLSENPSARIVLVGHTDSVGSLEANAELSRKRAAAAAQFLELELQVDPEQLDSSGVGYLSPVASNLTADGRAANRRVEAVLLSLE